MHLRREAPLGDRTARGRVRRGGQGVRRALRARGARADGDGEGAGGPRGGPAPARRAHQRAQGRDPLQGGHVRPRLDRVHAHALARQARGGALGDVRGRPRGLARRRARVPAPPRLRGALPPPRRRLGARGGALAPERRAEPARPGPERPEQQARAPQRGGAESRAHQARAREALPPRAPQARGRARGRGDPQGVPPDPRRVRGGSRLPVPAPPPAAAEPPDGGRQGQDEPLPISVHRRRGGRPRHGRRRGLRPVREGAVGEPRVHDGGGVRDGEPGVERDVRVQPGRV